MARFSGRQTPIGSAKVNGNKGVLRAHRKALRERGLVEEPNTPTVVEVTTPVVKMNPKPAAPKAKKRKRAEDYDFDAAVAKLETHFPEVAAAADKRMLELQAQESMQVDLTALAEKFNNSRS